MNKDADTMTSEYEIGSAGKISLMQAIPEALSMKQLPDLHFRRCVATADARHHSRPDFSADYVHAPPKKIILSLSQDTSLEKLFRFVSQFESWISSQVCRAP